MKHKFRVTPPARQFPDPEIAGRQKIIMSLEPAHLAALEALDAVVRSEAFLDKCESFLAKHAAEFDTDSVGSENRLEWTQIHADYEKQVDEELSAGMCHFL